MFRVFVGADSASTILSPSSKLEPLWHFGIAAPEAIRGIFANDFMHEAPLEVRNSLHYVGGAKKY